MSKLYINEAKSLHWDDTPSSDQMAQVKDLFPSKIRRRMTRLGLMMGELLHGVEIDSNTSIIYVSTFAETLTIEKYLKSFPFVSPQGFQMSIHPSSVEQVCVNRKQPMDRFFPITGKFGLVEMALNTAFLENNAERIIILGGEERGTWLTDHELASEINEASLLILSKNEKSSLGYVSKSNFDTNSHEFQSSGLKELKTAIDQKKDTYFNSLDRGKYEFHWKIGNE